MRTELLLVIALMAGGAAAVSLGEMESEVSLSSVRELWSDVLRDADQFGLQLTRVSDAAEMQLGAKLAGGISAPRNAQWQPYVEAVGASLAPAVRRTGIRYQFTVIDSSGVNAFALPGGRIYVLRGLLEQLQSEAELAAILGHEMTHVDLRHCIERYQYGLKLKQAGVGGVGEAADFARTLAAIGYAQYQEIEADAHGARLSIKAGYDPAAAARVFRRVFAASAQPPRRANAPLEELAKAAAHGLGDYFRTHPADSERLRRLEASHARQRRRLSGQSFYTGVQNYRLRVPRAQQEFPNERATY